MVKDLVVMDVDKELKHLAGIYQKIYGTPPEAISRIPSSGSDRSYFRFHGAKENVIAAVGPDKTENRCFEYLSLLFQDHGCNVPRIFGATEYSYLQSDLGDTSLFSILGSPEAENLIDQSLLQLVKLQNINREEWRHIVFNKDFSRRQILWDLNYFKYEFLLPSSPVYNEDRLQDDFDTFSTDLLDTPSFLWGFMYRDFQSRNIMVKSGQPFMIDYQGGRYGPCLYDAISFLWQAKAGFSDGLRWKMLRNYARYFSVYRGIEPSLILDNAEKFILFRMLQVLGAYGFRGLVQHKSHFVESIPAAILNLRQLMDDGALDKYSELKNVTRQLVENPAYRKTETNGRLRIEVFSFSYKKGYPQDLSGNGGGFMFDCRGMHNPGRYDRYKLLTGLDSPVVDFLEQRGEAQSFLGSVWEITDPTAERYIKRNFTNLQIGFGCTGGQHRSVYCAEQTAWHLASRFPEAVVSVCHRERNISYKLNDSK